MIIKSTAELIKLSKCGTKDVRQNLPTWEATRCLPKRSSPTKTRQTKELRSEPRSCQLVTLIGETCSRHLYFKPQLLFQGGAPQEILLRHHMYRRFGLRFAILIPDDSNERGERVARIGINICQYSSQLLVARKNAANGKLHTFKQLHLKVPQQNTSYCLLKLHLHWKGTSWGKEEGPKRRRATNGFNPFVLRAAADPQLGNLECELLEVYRVYMQSFNFFRQVA
ncbi:hypothetical protein C0J52_01684 [Blattella germanica]|nr:hypothetical protein C0J52_01684 [Blattella germanica]